MKFLIIQSEAGHFHSLFTLFFQVLRNERNVRKDVRKRGPEDGDFPARAFLGASRTGSRSRLLAPEALINNGYPNQQERPSFIFKIEPSPPPSPPPSLPFFAFFLRDCKHNFKRSSMHRVACKIHNSTLKTSNWE